MRSTFFFRFNLVHFQAMQDFHDGVNCVFKIVMPGETGPASAHPSPAVFSCVGKAGQVIKQNDQIADERFLQRLVEKIIAII